MIKIATSLRRRCLQGCIGEQQTKPTTNDKAADSDDRWTVPIGGGVAKTMRTGGKPVKVQFSIEKSIVRPDSFGLDWNIRLNIIPVIVSPQKNPFFGK